jgi:hypothetical protein
MKIVNKWLDDAGKEVIESQQLQKVFDEFVGELNKYNNDHPEWVAEYAALDATQYRNHPYARLYIAARNRAILKALTIFSDELLAYEDNSGELAIAISEHLGNNWVEPTKGDQ